MKINKISSGWFKKVEIMDALWSVQNTRWFGWQWGRGSLLDMYSNQQIKVWDWVKRVGLKGTVINDVAGFILWSHHLELSYPCGSKHFILAMVVWTNAYWLENKLLRVTYQISFKFWQVSKSKIKKYRK